MILFQWHVALMAAGSLMAAAAVLIAATQRQRRWWLRFHRGAGLSGAFLILTGGAAAVAAVTLDGGEHLRSPHTWFGALTLAAAVATPLLGFLQFKVPERVEGLRATHRLCGRILTGFVLITILLGFRAAGFL
ncbi:MAG: hypothetical protein JXL20_10220 [Deltaproteobacteria bacterium]|nr:hypothetical protein [Deltaproteobacteria bacterium]